VTNGISNQTLKKLEEWVTKEACSSRFLNFYKSLLRIQAEVEESIAIHKTKLPEKTVDSHMSSGKPLLRFDVLASDWPKITDTFNRVTAAFAEYPDLFGEVPEILLKKKPIQKLTKKTAKAWFEGKDFQATIAGEDINIQLLDSLIHQSLRPFLLRHSQTLIEVVNQAGWRRGYCPICGGQPDIGYLDKETTARWLMCSRCDAHWRFQRLECYNCGNQDSKSIPCFSDNKGGYRLYVCDKCHAYLKVVDFRNAEAEVFLPLERLLTLDMDRQGQEMGYKPGSYLGRGF